MFDKLLNLLCALDWITPTVAFVQDFLNAPFCDFGIPANPYIREREIKRLLKENGVHVWGVMYTFNADVLLFTVPKDQAELTYAILREAGIPIQYSPIK